MNSEPILCTAYATDLSNARSISFRLGIGSSWSGRGQIGLALCKKGGVFFLSKNKTLRKIDWRRSLSSENFTLFTKIQNESVGCLFFGGCHHP